MLAMLREETGRLLAEIAQAVECAEIGDLNDPQWREFVVTAALLIDPARYDDATWREAAAQLTGTPCGAQSRVGAILWMRDH